MRKKPRRTVRPRGKAARREAAGERRGDERPGSADPHAMKHQLSTGQAGR
jgi:hypothetical protein